MALSPAPKPIGLFPSFYARQTEEIIIKEKVMSLSGDSFTIKTSGGVDLFQVKGEALSLSGRKHIMDMQGKNLFDIRKKHIALHTTFYAENDKEEEIFRVTSKFAIGSSKAVGTFKNVHDGSEHELLMKGNFLDSKAEITDSATGQPVAVIKRDYFNARELIGGQQTYKVAVAPNVDMALIVAMCICLDEKRNEK